MRSVKPWATRSAAVLLAAVVFVGAGCSKTPTAPTPPPSLPPPPPPVVVADAPSLTCVEGISRATANAAGMAVSFDTPAVTAGEGSVTVSCSPASGTTFAIGTTAVTCTATDTLNRAGTCSFNVTVSRLPTLSRTIFMAFGDSITAGEVTVPGSLFVGLGRITRQVVVPSAAYPGVLLRTLQGRYSSQIPSLVVANHGLAGEKAANGRSRFISSLNSVRPEAVLILHGHNDIPGGVDGAASTAAFEIERMVEEAKALGALVYLGTVLPSRPDGNKAIGQAFIDDFNARLRIVASRQGVTVVDTYAALATDRTRYIGIDGLHATEAGYAKIADTFFQVIQGTLEVR